VSTDDYHIFIFDKNMVLKIYTYTMENVKITLSVKHKETHPQETAACNLY